MVQTEQGFDPYWAADPDYLIEQTSVLEPVRSQL